MNRRSFFTGLAAMAIAPLAAVKTLQSGPTFKMLHYTCFKSKYDPLGKCTDWPIHGADEWTVFIGKGPTRIVEHFWRMRRL